MNDLNLVWQVVDLSSDSNWQFYTYYRYLEPLLRKLSMPVFQILGLWLHLKETFLGLGLTFSSPKDAM